MKKILLSLGLAAITFNAFCFVNPGQSGDMNPTVKYLLLGGIFIVIVFILLYLRTQNRKKSGM